MIYITRRETFSASHRLNNDKLSAEENRILFGNCNNPNGHGHNYILEVTISGGIEEKTGYVIDLKQLKKIVRENVVNKLDHKNLNMDVDFLRDVIPSSENIAVSGSSSKIKSRQGDFIQSNCTKPKTITSNIKEKNKSWNCIRLKKVLKIF